MLDKFRRRGEPETPARQPGAAEVRPLRPGEPARPAQPADTKPHSERGHPAMPSDKPSSATTPNLAPRAPLPPMPGMSGAPRDAQAAAGPAAPGPQAAGSIEGEGSKLIVGRNIRLKGEIASCDTLVVEGHVEASMDSRVIQIAESGVFIGEAGIDIAEVSGQFEGKLTARKRLVIRKTGRVSGTIRYGQIEIEAGGRISGDVQEQRGAEAASTGSEPQRARA
jgi:cytoskeletal protein CcmA (bactofilin family)